MAAPQMAVYWNRHRKLWSVRCVASRRVLSHRPALDLTGCVFRVSAAGRARAVREGRRNVHAVVVGRLAPARVPRRPLRGPVAEVAYNPFLFSHFYDRATDRSLVRAGRVCFLPTGRAVAHAPEYAP